MLQRSEINQLRQWGARSKRKPLVIRGARQVGKSTLVRAYADDQSLDLLAVNFERNPELAQAFVHREPDKILQTLRLMTGQQVDAEKTLLFLDEIQVAPDALVALRYFFEEFPELRVIAAGSLLEFTLAEAQFSMPVGRIEYFHMGPMSFEDFLLAAGHPELVEHLQGIALADLSKAPIPAPVHDRYLQLLAQYWIVGGMPEAVAHFVEADDPEDIRRVQQSIVSTYRDDFGKYSNGKGTDRVQLVFERLPTLVGGKFKYVQVSREHRSVELADALDKLCMARVAAKVHHVSANGVPLSAEMDARAFKVLFLDVGLVSAALHLNRLDLDGNDLTLVNQGALAEQFIGQHLLYSGPCYETPALHYWIREAKSSNAEIDYLLTAGQQVVPVEIKAGKTGRLRSLHQFLAEKQRGLGLRFNADVPSFLEDNQPLSSGGHLDYALMSLPLYMVGQSRRLLDEHFASQ